jgi:glycosyltransferase involved in cell wall biosynthesis
VLPADLLASPLLEWNTAASLRRFATTDAVYHVMSAFEMSTPLEAVWPPAASATRLTTAVTLYDLIPLIAAERYLQDPGVAATYRARLEIVKAADVVFAISEHTRQTAIERLDLEPARVTTIGAGVSAFFRPPDVPGSARATVARARPDLTRRFVLSVTGEDDRKNTERLIEAFSLLSPTLRRTFQLVVVCDVSAPTATRWHEVGNTAGLSNDDLIVTGRITDELLRAMYQSSSLFVFPSLGEGFGLPVAEAIACGARAITSATTSSPEVLDFPPSTFDPTNTESIASLMQRALEDDSFRDELEAAAARRRGHHTWDEVADRCLAALPAAPARSHARPVRRLRLALVGPLRPVLSGVATYNSQVVAALAARCDLDVFGTGESDLRAALDDGALRALPISALGGTAHAPYYDLVIYTLGNSAHHHETYEKVSHWPGLLWLHDVRLHGLYLSYAARMGAERGRAFLAAALHHAYGTRTPPELLGDGWADHRLFTLAGVGLTAGVVDRSLAVVVQSDLARRMLAVDLANRQQPDVYVLPHAVPSPRGDSTTRDPGLVIAAGLVSSVKQPEVAVDAVAKLSSRSIRLAFVGPVEDGLRQELVDRAAAADVTVEFTGEVDDAEYWSWMRRASLAVQLRATNYGESSGAVHDCIAATVPVITNLASAAALAESEVVEFLPEVSAERIAAEIDSLLFDGGRAEAMRAAQHEYGRANTFDEVANGLLSIVKSVVATTGQRMSAS